ncbi:MAG: hypothetical protein V4808_07235 [Pseudomonadota bacterium]
MTLRTGLVITGDTDSAQKAVAALAGGMERATGAAQGLAAGERVAEAATEGLENELRQALAAISALENELGSAQGAVAALGGRIDILETKLNRAGSAGRANVRSMGEQALGARMLGQQFQDMGIMASMSTMGAADVLRIFSMQAGQTALAVEQMGVNGAVGRTAAFLGSPWGSIIMAATMVLAPFVMKLFETSTAAEAAEVATSGLADAENTLAELFGKTSSKIAEQNELLRINARIKAANLRVEAAENRKDAAKVFGQAGSVGGLGLGVTMALGSNAADYLGVAGNTGVAKLAERARLAANAPRTTGESDESYARFQGKLFDKIVQDAQTVDFKGSGYSQSEFLEGISKQVAAQANESIAKLWDKSLNENAISPLLAKPGPKPPTPKSTASRDEFGRDAADRIASITEAFDDTPAAVRQADKAIRQLDDLIEDLGRKKPPNFGELISSANAAKDVVENGLLRAIGEAFDKPETLATKAAMAFDTLDGLVAQQAAKLKAGLIDQAAFDAFIAKVAGARTAIEDGLSRPYTDFLLSQHEALEVERLLSQGRNDEADAMRVILQLEKAMGPLTEARKDAIEQTVTDLRQARRETDALHAKQQAFLGAIGDTRSLIVATIAEGADGLQDLPERLLGSFKRFFAEWATEKVFGQALRDLEDMVTNRPEDPVKAAAGRVANAVDDVTPIIRHFGEVLSSASAQAATSRLATAGAAGAAGAADAGDDYGEIIVNGISAAKNPLAGLGNPRTFFSDMFKRLGEEVGIDEETARKIGKGIAGGLEGAFFGQLSSGIAAMAGVKQDSTGAGIGGALGGAAASEFLSKALGSFAGPLGGLVGGLLGGTIGGLLSKPSYGTATLGNASDAAALSGRGGAEGGAGGAAGSVQSGLKDIADQLGGELGKFAVSIGTFDGKWRVSTTGFGGQLDSKTARGQGLVDFGKEGQAAAIAFAIADAIKDGAVTGLSAAVQQAIGSSPDVEAALREALKVSELEQMMGGLSGEIERAIKAENMAAAERVRIARTYGFDLVEIEKLNGEKRMALTKQLLDKQVGSLQRLVDQMTHGSMFAGSSVDQRTALLGAIETAKADLTNGVEGAADTLAGLYEQLITVSEAVYGSTGGFAADRSAVLDQARAAIASANARINATQGQTSDPALAETNKALDENNDQNAKAIAELAEIKAAIAKLAAQGNSAGDLSALMQLAKTG